MTAVQSITLHGVVDIKNVKIIYNRSSSSYYLVTFLGVQPQLPLTSWIGCDVFAWFNALPKCACVDFRNDAFGKEHIYQLCPYSNYE